MLSEQADSKMAKAGMIEQRSPEWFAQRISKITGSRAGAILGLSPYGNADSVMRDMVREYFHAINGNSPSEFTGNVATVYGTNNEDNAISKFESDHGFQVVETGQHTHNDYEWLAASPDGLVGHNAVLEVKCPYGKREAQSSKDFKTVDEQQHYYAQMQLEMICTDRELCHFYQWSAMAYRYDLVLLDVKWVKKNLPLLKAFHDLYLETISDEALYQIYLEDAEIDMSLDGEWLTLEAEYLAAINELDACKKKVDKLKVKLVDMAGGKKCRSNNLTVYSTQRKGSIAYAKVLEKLDVDIDLEPYRGKPSTSWTVKVKK